MYMYLPKSPISRSYRERTVRFFSRDNRLNWVAANKGCCWGEEVKDIRWLLACSDSEINIDILDAVDVFGQ